MRMRRPYTIALYIFQADWGGWPGNLGGNEVNLIQLSSRDVTALAIWSYCQTAQQNTARDNMVGDEMSPKHHAGAHLSAGSS